MPELTRQPSTAFIVYRRRQAQSAQLGIAADAIIAGAQIGAQVVTRLFDNAKIRGSEESKRDAAKEIAYNALERLKLTAKAGRLDVDNATLEANDIINQYYAFVSEFATSRVRRSAENYRAMAGGFNERRDAIVSLARANYKPPSLIITPDGAMNNATTNAAQPIGALITQAADNTPLIVGVGGIAALALVITIFKR